jgi:hypothetical protein
MTSREESLYRLDPTGPADEQVRKLLAKAAARGEQQEVLEALQAIAHQLKTRPHDWGDPERRTQLEGGMVYHAIERPLMVWYVVFEPRKVVWLLEVRALPNSPLAE